MVNNNPCIFNVVNGVCYSYCVIFLLSAIFLFFESVVYSFILGISATNNSKDTQYLYPWANMQVLVISNMFASAIMLFSNKNKGFNWYTLLTISINLAFRFWSLVIMTHVVINDNIDGLSSNVWNCIIESTIIFCVVVIISSISGIVWCCKRSCAKALENQRELNRVKKELEKTKKQLEGTTSLPYSVEIKK